MAIPFVHDIYTALSVHYVACVSKEKCKRGRVVHGKYRIFLGTVKNKPNFIAVAPDISAVTVSATCTATISMSFTSTALIEKAMGKPSVFYDSS